MSRVLAIDVGAGTMDVLCVDTDSGESFKAVVRSPVALAAERARRLPGKLLVLGREMGGGAVSRALAERARTSEVLMSISASATLHHDPERVRALGIRVIDDEAAAELAREGSHRTLHLRDLEIDRLQRIVAALGLPFSFDVVAVCAQDHGVAERGVSPLDKRHQGFKAALDRDPRPEGLLFRADQVPRDLTRLGCIARDAAALPAGEVYVMDSGMAAILGASTDPEVARRSRALVLDVATSHTLGAALLDHEIAGFFEYHTCDVTLPRLEALLRDLADGRIDHARILAEGGHGAYLRRSCGFEAIGIILATGPRRALVAGSRLPLVLGAPLGDNMMTGTAGLLEAVGRRRGAARR